MNKVRQCLTCGGIEAKTFYCNLCGHSETWHNYNFTGRCQCLCNNSLRNPELPVIDESNLQCECIREDIANEMKAISYYNEIYKQWWPPFILKCTCDKPNYGSELTHDRDPKFKWK